MLRVWGIVQVSEVQTQIAFLLLPTTYLPLPKGTEKDTAFPLMRDLCGILVRRAIYLPGSAACTSMGHCWITPAPRYSASVPSSCFLLLHPIKPHMTRNISRTATILSCHSGKLHNTTVLSFICFVCRSEACIT